MNLSRGPRIRGLAARAVPVIAAALLAACQSPPPPAPTAAVLPPDVQPCRLAPLPPPRMLDKPPGTVWAAPAAPAYPYPDDPALVTAQARCLSDALQRYVTAWLDGRVPAQIPDAFIPAGIDRKGFRSFTLVRPEDVTPAQQWIVRPALPVDPQRLRHSFPDPVVTYLLLPGMLVPFGTQVVVEGEFPHARFFNLQVTPSFDPRSYRYDGGIGVGEVPIVDADIDPLPGHVNPYRVGADRTATRRGYRVTFHTAIGDPVALNPAFRPPHFRGAGNERVGGGLLFQGPWGAVKGFGHGRGVWTAGEIWGRYYLPDRARGALGGVPLPKVHYVAPDGRRWFLRVDWREFGEMANKTYPLAPTRPVEPSTRPRTLGVEAYWTKQTGIFRALVTGIAQNTNWAGPAYVRQLDRGVAGRGADLSPPNDYEQSATSATYVDYLGRGMSLGAGKVAVLTGRLPTFPATEAGQATMTAAQMRYWSIVGYEVPEDWAFFRAMFGADSRPGGLAVHHVYDEQVVLDRDRRYVIVLSRPQDRPRNARPQDGVTWVDWGPSSMVAWTLRWKSVGPEWTGPMSPTPARLGWAVDWAEPGHDPRLLGNHHGGPLGEYLPRAHYLTREQFERLGSPVRGGQVPLWR